MKQIKQWFRQYNKQYTHAAEWHGTLQQREEKKIVLRQEIAQVQKVTYTPVVTNAQGNTIFHRDNLGRNGEETQKIKQIYGELETIFSAPALAA